MQRGWRDKTETYSNTSRRKVIVGRNYLFDTMVHVAAVHRVPEKWLRQWKDATIGHGRLLLFDSLIAELFFGLAKKFGAKVAEERISWLKSLPNSFEITINNRLARRAAGLLLKFKKYGLGLTDAFMMSIAVDQRGNNLYYRSRSAGCVSAVWS